MAKDCHNISVALLAASVKAALSPLVRVACLQLQAALSVLKTLLQAEQVVLVPAADLNALFVQNFVIFPLNAAQKTTESLSNLGNNLSTLGIDRACHKEFYSFIDKETGKLKSISKSLGSASRSMQKEIDDVNAELDGISKAINDITDFQNISCQ